MNRYNRFVIILTFILLLIPMSSQTADWKEELNGKWAAEDLKAWGDANLAVDFGVKGLWNYDENWIQLSRWNPLRMEALGSKKLVVDFGADGLWLYDGRRWMNISH